MLSCRVRRFWMDWEEEYLIWYIGMGRFSLIMGLTALYFGFGPTLSNLLGQHLVEHMGHVERFGSITRGFFHSSCYF